jgi:hypothetical protein
MDLHCTAIGPVGGKLRSPVVTQFSPRRSPLVLVVLGAAALGCSSRAAILDSGADAPNDTTDARADTGVADGDAGDAEEAGADGDDGAPPFTLGLSPPPVDCRPYAGLPACALRVAPGPARAGADGLTWATAFSDVQDALDRATCGCDVWISAGTYLPTRSIDAPQITTPDPRDLSFVLWPGAHVFGGFVGSESDPAARVPLHETILSGDLGAPGVTDDNAYHVVVGADGATLDGLTIRDGEADGIEDAQTVGAGLVAFGASMTLRNVALTDNDADSGAGIYGDKLSSPHVVGCTFARNTANDGGAMVVLGASAVVEGSLFEDNVGVFSGPAITQFAAALTVTDSRFLRNRGDSGGAITASGGHADLERCWFEGNEAGSFGGAMLVRFGASVRLSSSVLVANGSVGYGGALAVWTSTLDVEAATIVDNVAFFGGAFLVKDGSTFSLSDSVVWRNPDDAGHAFFLDGVASAISVSTSDLPPEVPAPAPSFEADPLLANVPLATRFAVQAGTSDQVPVTGADKVFKVGDRIELADDGTERRVTSVAGDELGFAPALSPPAPRFLRIDLWPEGTSLDLDLTPTAMSPLVDAASASAPPLDVTGRPRVGASDIGAIERR